MSFFDDDDPPTQLRRASAPPPLEESDAPAYARPVADPATIRQRRIFAIAGLLVGLILITVLINGCVNSSRRNGIRNYNTSVSELAAQSEDLMSQVFKDLRDTSGTGTDALTQRLGESAIAQDELTKRAKKLSTPGGLQAATQNLVTALDLRAEAVRRIGARMAAARSNQTAAAEGATEAIAGQFGAIYASDVLWATRVTPYIADVYKDQDLNESDVKPSSVFKDLGWLSTATVSNRIGGTTTQARDNNDQRPGAHGHALNGVKINSTTLSTTSPTSVTAGKSLAITAEVQNGGDWDESNVVVTATGVRVDDNTRLFSQTAQLKATTKGRTTPATINVNKPVTGPVRVTVTIRPVGQEKDTSNNSKTFEVSFK